MPLDLFQHQEVPLLVRNFGQELENVVPPRQIDIGRHLAHGGFGILHPARFILAQIALIYQLAHLLFAQIIEALVDRDLVNPGDQRAAEIKIADGEINLGKHLLRDILHIVALPDDAVDDGEYLRLVVLHDLAERPLVTRLRPAHKSAFLAVLIVHSGSGNGPGIERWEWEGASQCSHTPLPTRPAFSRLHLSPTALPL